MVVIAGFTTVKMKSSLLVSKRYIVTRAQNDMKKLDLGGIILFGLERTLLK